MWSPMLDVLQPKQSENPNMEECKLFENVNVIFPAFDITCCKCPTLNFLKYF